MDRVAYGIPNRLHGDRVNEQEHSEKDSTKSDSNNGEMRNVRSDRSKNEPAPYRLYKAYGGNGSLHQMPCKGTFEASGYCDLCSLRKNICGERSPQKSQNMQQGMSCEIWTRLRDETMGHFWDNGEPDVERVAYGISHRVDRIKCLGNAVVPEAFYPIFMWIKEIEDES